MLICLVEVFNNVLKITAPKIVLQKISEKFTYRDISKAFVWGKFQKHNVKIVKLLKPLDKHHAVLPIGLLDELEELLSSISLMKYKIVDRRSFKKYKFDDEQIRNCLKTPLRDYQVEAVKSFIEHKNMIIKAPTGSGKTKVMAALIKLLDLKTLVLCHKKDLVHQTYKRFIDDGIKYVGIVQANNYKPGKVIVATIQSAHKIPDLNSFEFIIVDEIHRANAPTYQNVLMNVTASYRLGLSATPFSRDKLHKARVKSWIGPIKYELPAKELVESGFLAEPTIYFVPIDKVEVRLKNSRIVPRNIEDYKWIGAERNGIIRNEFRNNKIAKLAKSVKKPVVILIKNIEHGEILLNKIPEAIFIHGSTPLEERQKAIELIETSSDAILIGSTIMDEGIDIINIRSLIVAAGGRSFVRALQRIGRALRRSKTKHKVDIYDFMDRTNRYLEKHSLNRLKAYKKEGFQKINVRLI